MEIKSIKTNLSLSAFNDLIDRRINNGSRFTCNVEIRNNRWIKLINVRLKEKKPYCGNHPMECENPFGFERKTRMGRYLEGVDWVDFNDTLNDILDDYSVSANIHSSVCWIRKGTSRRIKYSARQRGFFWQWSRDEDDSSYEDWCGKDAPNSIYPAGPGLYLRNEKKAV